MSGLFVEKAVHPTPKPLDTMVHIVQLAASVGAVVIDPFSGSGTTLLACKLTNRHAIGIEIEERYCEIAAERCRQTVLDLASPPPTYVQASLDTPSAGPHHDG